MFLICTLSTAPKRPKWVYGAKIKTRYFVEIQRFDQFVVFFKWCHRESNQGHKDFQSFALPTELWHQPYVVLSFPKASAKVRTFFDCANLCATFFKKNVVSGPLRSLGYPLTPLCMWRIRWPKKSHSPTHLNPNDAYSRSAFGFSVSTINPTCLAPSAKALSQNASTK